MKLCRLGWHHWTPWKQYTWTGRVKPPFVSRWFESNEERQKRDCLDCGLRQDEEI